MILTAHPLPGIPLSSSCTLYFSTGLYPMSGSLAVPEDLLEKKKHSFPTRLSESALKSLSQRSYLVLSHTGESWQEEEIAALSHVITKGAHIVLEGGLLETQYLENRKEPVEQLRAFEKTFFRSCSLLVSMKSISWSMAAPFVLKLLMQMREGTTLFLDPGMSALPSIILSDIVWGLKQHVMKPASHVTFVVLFRQGVVASKEGPLEIPFFQELEKLQCELQVFPEAGVACVEKEGVRPLFSSFQSLFLKQAIERKMSVRSLLRMTLRQEMHLTLSQIEEIEEELYELEKTFLAHRGEIPEESSFHALLESIMLQTHLTH